MTDSPSTTEPGSLMEARPTRNIVARETAEHNRENRAGGYTFNAFPPEDYAGTIIEFGCVRIGDHAHVHVESGRQTPSPSHPVSNTGFAGKLTLRWDEWLILRETLDADARMRVAEVENPTPGMARRYAGARP